MWWNSLKALRRQFWGWRWGFIRSKWLTSVDLFALRCCTFLGQTCRLGAGMGLVKWRYLLWTLLHYSTCKNFFQYTSFGYPVFFPQCYWGNLGFGESENVARLQCTTCTKVSAGCGLQIYVISVTTHQVVGHFTVHGLSVSVSVNTGAGGIQANINTNNNVMSALDHSPFITILCDHWWSKRGTK